MWVKRRSVCCCGCCAAIRPVADFLGLLYICVCPPTPCPPPVPHAPPHNKHQVGCAIMALGAMAGNPGLKLRIIPVGVNYFRGHRFRSRVFIDVGTPIVPSMDLIESFKAGGHEKFLACNELLGRIRIALSTVTVEADSFDDLQFIRAMRRLYATFQVCSHLAVEIATRPPLVSAVPRVLE